MPVSRSALVATVLGLALTGSAQERPGFESRDLYRLRSVGEVQISPDGARIAYTVRTRERPGAPASQLWMMDVATGRPARLDRDDAPAWGPRWSPDGRRIAYLAQGREGAAVFVARPDGSSPVRLAPVMGTNHPLPSTAESLAWSPDGRRLAFVSATPGPEPTAGSDPFVITRYLYKPTAAEGMTRFNDNRRVHIFVVDLMTRVVRPLTDGPYYEHSIAWSPAGDEISFLSNREADPDRVFNYDVFAIRVADGALRRITQTRSAEYAAAWSPDGKSLAYLATKRPLTSSETTMEDTHVWVMDASGGARRELGEAIDNRQGPPRWSPDGGALYFTAEERGSERLYRLSLAGGPPEAVLPNPEGRGVVSDWSIARDGTIACALATPSAPAELYLVKGNGARALTSLNGELLGGKALAEVEAFTFRGEGGLEIEAFLTHPLGRTATSRHPLIVTIHGGPHAQDGPNFRPRAQAYAREGWASLAVNYRGSTGYGQRLADAIFHDQDGAEARDVLAGVDAALARHPWLDPTRLGIEGVSYGGQLTNWIVTQTDRFKAAVPIAGIANLVSFNYTAYYHDYLAVEFGSYPHEDGLMDLLWERSPLRYVARVKTPVLILHGENDNDVPIGEAEQLYIALKDAGLEAVLVRYPREGHGLRETGHLVDALDRSVAWYRRHFAGRP